MSEPRVLNGRYRVGELIGRGGVADVFRGSDLLLDRPVALKLMRPDLARDAAFQERFRAEASHAATLEHPRIIAVYDGGVEQVTEGQPHPVECPFLVLEEVAGPSLREVVRDGAVPWRRAVAWTTQVLEALEHAHGQGIQHRDLKPANMMLTATGTVKVMDFGLAAALTDTSSAAPAARTVVGTAVYLSPEQVTGREADARSDLYSVGCVLVELLTGTPPFTGDTPLAVAHRHVREEPPVPSALNPSVPPAVDAVVLRALRKDPAERFSSAAEFRRALEAAAADPEGVPDTAPSAARVPECTDDPDPVTAGHAVAGTSLPGAPSEAQLAAAATVDTGPTPSTGPRPVVVASRTPTGPLPLLPAPSPAPVPPPAEAPEPVTAMGTSRRRLGALLLVTLVALLALVAALTLGRWVLEGSRRDVPDLRGRAEAEAVQTLEGLGLRAAVISSYSADVPRGQVVSEDPGGGTPVPPGTEVRLHVSRGPDGVLIPESLHGEAEGTVLQELDRLGLSVSSVQYQDAGGLAHGRLVRTEPSLGSTVDPGSPVVLHLSSGMVVMPDVRGLSAGEAQATLRAAASELTQRLHSADGEPAEQGTVVAQDPSAGARVDNRAAVTLTVSSGAEPTAASPMPAVGAVEDSSPSP